MTIEEVLGGLKIKADIDRVECGDTVTRIYLRLHPGSKVCRIENCATEIALGTKSYGKPIIRVLSEEGLVCIELLNNKMQQVSFNEFDQWFNSGLIKEYGDLPIVLGKTHDGTKLVVDLSQMPHLLVAGSSGSGKSVLLHSIICSLIKGGDIRLALIDAKQVEFQIYKDIRQLLYPVVSAPGDALDVLDDLIQEMDNRFVLLGQEAVNNIKAYNKIREPIPYIVAVLDEFSDLQRSCKKEFQSNVCILAQKARAVGIHLVLATQRPDVSVITGVVKSNFVSRIALKTASATDSRVILDLNGSERLQGKGDAIINSGNLDMVRFQSAYISASEIEKLCEANKRKMAEGFFDFLKGLR